jgi:hypothetical protein
MDGTQPLPGGWVSCSSWALARHAITGHLDTIIHLNEPKHSRFTGRANSQIDLLCNKIHAVPAAARWGRHIPRQLNLFDLSETPNATGSKLNHMFS